MPYDITSLEPKLRERTGRLHARSSSPSDLNSHDTSSYAHFGVGETATAGTQETFLWSSSNERVDNNIPVRPSLRFRER